MKFQLTTLLTLALASVAIANITPRSTKNVLRRHRIPADGKFDDLLEAHGISHHDDEGYSYTDFDPKTLELIADGEDKTEGGDISGNGRVRDTATWDSGEDYSESEGDMEDQSEDLDYGDEE
ncbi:hypothetical protein HYFRA_00006864 [Hymenoscyphus fraxineus]|uniref:Uncharacterized protein n=1 Tax=Hymenoscyphus fraxineus TaxID=746836 RepID=A0A9N9KNT7_9HELO|nr:hypothetical protein HYFRA_00006864 [Hymenoscyphus fraxineus]